jgi:membrane-associated phospholipid phosphatase
MTRALCVALALSGATGRGAAQLPTSVSQNEAMYDRGDWVLVGSLLAAHAVLLPLDDDVRELAAEFRSDGSDQVADVLYPLGAARELAVAGAAIYLVGLAASNRRVADLGLHALASLAISTFVTGVLKTAGGRARPSELQGPHEWDFFDGWRDERRSYPSGHSTRAFAVAAVFSEELGGATPWIAYPIAAGVAWSRVNDDGHWASDVVLGGVIGIVSGQLVVRRGHRGDGWLERTLLLRPSPSSGGLDLGMRIPLTR